MERTVIVVGGGACACSLALSLGQLGLACVMLERSPETPVRAGEHLPPEVRPLLAALGLWEPFLAQGYVASPGTCAAWGGPALYDREYIFNPHGCGWNLDRSHFDAWLAATAAQSGARLYYGAVVGALHRRSAGWEVAVRIGGQQAVLRGDFLVDATGRAAAVARKLGSLPIAYDRMVGVVGRSHSGEAHGSVDCRLLIEAVPDGWWYAAALPGRGLVAAFLTDPPLPAAARAGLVDFWLGQLAQTSFVRERLAGCEFPNRMAAYPAGTQRTEPLYGQNWLAAGDAAAALDPLSSMGITRALAGGRAAARAIADHLAGDAGALPAYAAQVNLEFERQLALRAFYYRQVQRWPDRPFWARRQAHTHHQIHSKEVHSWHSATASAGT